MSPICEHKVAISDSCDNNILLQSASNINHSLLSTLATSLELFAYTLLHMLHTLYGFKSGCLAATDQSSEVGGGGVTLQQMNGLTGVVGRRLLEGEYVTRSNRLQCRKHLL